MTEDESGSSGVLGSFRRLIDALVTTIHNRVELFAVELQEEKSYLVATLIWVAASIFFGILAILVLCVTVVWLCPEGARSYVLVGFSVLFILLAVSAISGLRKLMKEKPSPLSETLSELKKDLDWLRSQD